MGRRPACLAALTLAPLLLATPALAQVQTDEGDERRTTLGPSYAEMQGRQSDFVGQDGALFPDRASGLGVSAQPFVREDGSKATRTGLVGSVPVSSNMNVGVGLFSINRTSPRDRDLRRLQPMRDVNDRGSRMAAVGLSVRFR
ncbi:MAG TPA: hypothetical protein VF628_12800 [Allosphingosinicella sp.]|jgi:hypothetical protein